MRYSLELPDSPDAVRVIKAIAAVLVDTEECASQTSLAVGGGSTESGSPRGDAYAIEVLGRQVRALERTLGRRAVQGSGYSSGMYARLDRLVADITSRAPAPIDYEGVLNARGPGRPKGADNAHLEAKLREMGLVNDN